MTDPDTTAAVEALAHRIRERDAAMNDGDDYADAEVFAAEYIQALRAKAGWRPTNAAPPAIQTGSGLPTRDDTLAAVAELRKRLATPATDPEDGVA